MSLNSVEIEKYRELRDAVLEGRELTSEQAAMYRVLDARIKDKRDEVSEMSEKDLAGIEAAPKQGGYTEPGRGEWKPEVKTMDDAKEVGESGLLTAGQMRAVQGGPNRGGYAVVDNGNPGAFRPEKIGEFLNLPESQEAIKMDKIMKSDQGHITR